MQDLDLLLGKDLDQRIASVLDSDYRGPVKVALHNDSNDPQPVQAGSRIAQLIVAPYERVDFEVVDELDETNRGSGGFGSTGAK